MRVSIVATALDGQQPESKSVINMVHEFKIEIQVIMMTLFYKKIIILIIPTLFQALVEQMLYK